MKSIPDATWIESVVSALERHPFGALVLLAAFFGVIYWATHARKT